MKNGLNTCIKNELYTFTLKRTMKRIKYVNQEEKLTFWSEQSGARQDDDGPGRQKFPQTLADCSAAQSLRQIAAKMAGVLFEDIFNVKDIDPEGKKFDRGKFMKYY